MSKPVAITIEAEFSKLSCLNNRTPNTTDEEAKDASALLSEYRDGGIYIVHYAGYSEWEMHAKGDEFIHIVDGETTLILLEDNQEQHNKLSSGQIFVVPKGIWHRFESPDGVKVMSITPEPTQHSNERPSNT